MTELQYPHLRNHLCALPEPYPKPQVECLNTFYAALLLEDYTGAVSEMTAINQYLYHHFTFHDKYKELAELEECIAIIEMMHMELLAETIIQLGVDPEFRTLSGDMPIFWNASAVYYGYDVYDRLDADIAAETQAIQNYRQHRDCIDDPGIQRLLERIIMDEEHHLRLFCQAREKLCSGA